MIYQEGCMSCWKGYESAWLTDFSLDATNQTLWKTVSHDDGATWSDRVQILSNIDDPHIHYQVIPGLDVDEEGYSKEVIIPVHHLDESVTDGNYQMLWRCNRQIDPDDGSWSVVNMSKSSDLDQFGGYIQSSIVRPDAGMALIAFLHQKPG